MASVLRQARVAEITGLSESKIEKMRLKGDGPPFIKIGKAVGYLESDLTAWLSSCRRTSTSDHGVAA